MDLRLLKCLYSSGKAVVFVVYKRSPVTLEAAGSSPVTLALPSAAEGCAEAIHDSIEFLVEAALSRFRRSYSPVSTVTAITIGAVASGPFTSSIVSIDSLCCG